MARHTLRQFTLTTLLLAFPLAATATAQEECPVRIDFAAEDSGDYWQVINDNVMGGRSLGDIRFDQSTLIFEGSINTNGGGFSSIRANFAPGALEDTQGLRLRVKSDGRTYKVTLRTNAFFRGRQVAFQAEIPLTPKGEWATVTIPYEDLEPSIFGRPIRNVTFEKENANILGLIISDGLDGDFRLDVEFIESC